MHWLTYLVIEEVLGEIKSKGEEGEERLPQIYGRMTEDRP